MNRDLTKSYHTEFSLFFKKVLNSEELRLSFKVSFSGVAVNLHLLKASNVSTILQAVQ